MLGAQPRSRNARDEAVRLEAWMTVGPCHGRITPSAAVRSSMWGAGCRSCGNAVSTSSSREAWRLLWRGARRGRGVLHVDGALRTVTTQVPVPSARRIVRRGGRPCVRGRRFRACFPAVAARKRARTGQYQLGNDHLPQPGKGEILRNLLGSVGPNRGGHARPRAPAAGRACDGRGGRGAIDVRSSAPTIPWRRNIEDQAHECRPGRDGHGGAAVLGVQRHVG